MLPHIPRGLHLLDIAFHLLYIALPQHIPRGLHRWPLCRRGLFLVFASAHPAGVASCPHQSAAPAFGLCLSTSRGGCILWDATTYLRVPRFASAHPAGIASLQSNVRHQYYDLCLSTSRGDCITAHRPFPTKRKLCLSTSRGDCISNVTQGRMQILIEYAVSW